MCICVYIYIYDNNNNNDDNYFNGLGESGRLESFRGFLHNLPPPLNKK